MNDLSDQQAGAVVRVRTYHLISRPQGVPSGAEFALRMQTLPAVQSGQLLVENRWLSVDPYMRECMDAFWPLGQPLEGRALGQVIHTATPDFRPGQWVLHRHGWRSHALLSTCEAQALPLLDAQPRPAGSTLGPSSYLGLLGGTGLSAYVALSRIAQLRAGETVYISAAAGGVGIAAAQLARLMGAARVIGSTGSATKAALLCEHWGFDAVVNYREGRLADQLQQAAPQGIDVTVEGVGGDHLEAAIAAMRPHGRIAWVGAISQYNSPHVPPAAPRNLFEMVEKRLRLQGFLVRDHLDLQPELEQLLVPAMLAGKVRSAETIAEGLEQMVPAFLSMLSGGNVGKMLVRVRGRDVVIRLPRPHSPRRLSMSGPGAVPAPWCAGAHPTQRWRSCRRAART